MKKATFILSLISLLYTGLFAQTSVIQTYDRATREVRAIQDQGNEVVRMEIDVLTNSLKERSVSRVAKKGYNYTIIGFADQQIESFTVSIYKGSTFIKKASSDSDNAVKLTFSPSEDANYTYYVTAQSFTEGNPAGYFCLLVSHDVGKGSTTPSSSTSSSSSSSLSGKTFKSVSAKRGVYDEDTEDIVWKKNFSGAYSFEFARNMAYMLYKEDARPTKMYNIKSKKYDAAKDIWTIESEDEDEKKSTWIVSLSDETIGWLFVSGSDTIVVRYTLE